MTYEAIISATTEDWCRSLLSGAVSGARPTHRVGIREWVESVVDLTPDAEARSPIQLDPYQVAPVEFLTGQGDRELTVVAPEQCGKSEIWRLYLLHLLVFDPCDVWIVYESDRKAADVNRTLILPRMRKIPKLALQLDAPNSYRQDAFYFPTAAVHYSGSGSPITSYSKRVVIADEVDFWQALTNDTAASKQSQKAQKNVDNLVNLRKRTRTYRNRGRRVIQVSSPTLKSGPIWRAFLRGSQGYWSMVCLQCGKLLRSCDSWLLQFERHEDGEPIDESIRLVCPTCKREHAETEAAEMNRPEAGAKYVHEVPERLEGRNRHMSVELGALACPRAISWLEIAEAVVDGGGSGTLEAQKILDNSYRGLPLQERKKTKDGEDTLLGHCAGLPDPATLRGILFSADTQDTGWYCVHRGVDDAGNLWGLRSRFVETLDELETEWAWRYGDMLALAGIIDEGGHRATDEVVPWMLAHAGMYTYKGESATRELCGWKVSEAKDRQRRLILANPYHFQEKLLWLMYRHTDPNAEGFWFLPPVAGEGRLEGMHDDYIDQVAALHENSRKKFGHEFRNWDAGGAPDHFFDAEKQILVLLDYALAKVLPRYWRGGQLPEYHLEKLRRQLRRRRG